MTGTTDLMLGGDPVASGSMYSSQRATRSIENFTSSACISLPVWNLMPRRRLNVQTILSSVL